jgi:AraC-like DNA-binding protein
MPELLTAPATAPTTTTTSAPSPAADSAPVIPAAGTGTEPQPSQPQADPRQLREAYEGLKSKYEPWEKLGLDPDQASRYREFHESVYSEASETARTLGYSEGDLESAFQQYGVSATLTFLQQESLNRQQQQQPPDGDISSIVDQRVAERITPIEQWQNQRMVEEANRLFEQTAYQCAADVFKAEGFNITDISPDELFALTSGASEFLKYDENALAALKFNGKTAGVQKAFQEIKGILDKYYLARQSRESKRLTPQRAAPAQAAPSTRKPSLDDLANDPSIIDEMQGRGSNGRYRAV